MKFVVGPWNLSYLIILKNLVTWITDSHRGSERVKNVNNSKKHRRGINPAC